jgi:ATP-dependent Lhr-like helicase
MSAAQFHPAVAAWFDAKYAEPSSAQSAGWPEIQAGKHTLIAAPTGSGKTLAAFLAAIDALVREGVNGTLGDELRVLYVSPLKALSNDIEKNLQEPLAGIQAQLVAGGYPAVEIRTWVRTGDTPAKERAKLRKQTPHILVTTPESLYILLTSQSGRDALKHVKSVIVDEIHAILDDKRGAHLALSLERLAALVEGPLQRIGLSATQKPIERVARFLTGSGTNKLEPLWTTASGVGAPRAALAESGVGPRQLCSEEEAPLTGRGSASDPRCAIVDCGHKRVMRLELELPRSPLEAVMSAEVWAEVYDRIAALVESNTTTLVFVSTRRLAERLCRQLAERLGEDKVAAHHGSLAKEIRLDAEQRLKAGKLKALVATASLELGIDIGAVDLVCQVGSTRSIAALLQRVGRSGHHKGGVPEGRIFPLSRDDLVECAALLDCVRRGELDAIDAVSSPLDILAQQIVATVANEDWSEDALFELARRSYPFRNLQKSDFEAVLEMLAEGFSSRRGRRGALIRRDKVGGRVQGRAGARLTALTSGGAIPDNADYRVVLEPDETHVGSVGEDFAIESMAGDIFQLGNASWRILKVENGLVRVQDAKGQPPTIPFWLGEAPARTDEVSRGVSRLVADVSAELDRAAAPDDPAIARWLERERGLGEAAAAQVSAYLSTSKQALGALPTHDLIVMERFFDEAQNTHLVIHSSYGGRINRAWGLALRKRFCKSFNFELQAAANENAIVLSLGPSHSFELHTVGKFLHSNSAEDVLVQALLDAPLFEVRWRHNATRSLATPRFRGGKKMPPNLLRIHANDFLSTAFPDQQACLENIVGEREIPDHPLVKQTIVDCLTEAMDAEGFVELLRKIEQGGVQVLYRDVTEASPLAHEILNANPYAFLDPAPLEERRTQAVITRRFFDPSRTSDLGALDLDAIRRVKEEAWPRWRNADELSDALGLAGFLDERELGADALPHVRELVRQGRATRMTGTGGGAIWVAAERLTQLRSMFPGARSEPELTLPASLSRPIEAEAAWVAIVRGRLESLGPITVNELARPLLGLGADVHEQVSRALVALETEGFAMTGRFTPGVEQHEWCERGLLARIHRYTLDRLRREIEPVSSAVFMRFLFAWQHVSPGERLQGSESVWRVVSELEGFESAASSWEGALLPCRVADYQPGWLDTLCLSGRMVWGRVSRPLGTRSLRSLSTTPMVLSSREAWPWVSASNVPVPEEELSGGARRLLALLARRGACFLQELRGEVAATPSELEAILSEAVAAGLVTSDSFSGMRGLLPAPRRKQRPGRRSDLRASPGLEAAGRWSLLRSGEPNPDASIANPDAERWARLLLRRYGLVFRRLIERENAPPWRDLLTEFRRLEARGEVRGGRFVTHHAGEQFALPEAVALLRKQRNAAPRGEEVCLSACDPLNLIGGVLPGQRVAASPTNSILFRDAAPIAAIEGGELVVFGELDPAERDRVKARLRRGPAAAEPQAQVGARALRLSNMRVA